jgi:hypothetical protein
MRGGEKNELKKEKFLRSARVSSRVCRSADVGFCERAGKHDNRDYACMGEHKSHIAGIDDF